MHFITVKTEGGSGVVKMEAYKSVRRAIVLSALSLLKELTYIKKVKLLLLLLLVPRKKKVP